MLSESHTSSMSRFCMTSSVNNSNIDFKPFTVGLPLHSHRRSYLHSSAVLSPGLKTPFQGTRLWRLGWWMASGKHQGSRQVAVVSLPALPFWFECHWHKSMDVTSLQRMLARFNCKHTICGMDVKPRTLYTLHAVGLWYNLEIYAT